MHKNIKIQISAGIIFFLAIIFGASFWAISNNIDPNPIFVGVSKKKAQIACTQEAQACPDGSYVGRIGPKCEFAECLEAQK